MGNGRFYSGDLVRIQVRDQEFRTFDDDEDGYVEAVVIQAENVEGEIVAAVVSGIDGRMTGDILRMAGGKFERVPGVRFEAVPERWLHGRENVIDEVRGSCTTKADQAEIEIDESAFIEIGNYVRHDRVNDLPDEELRTVVVGIWEAALRAAEQDGRVGAGHVRNVILQLCDDPFGDCAGAAARILEGADNDLNSL